MEVYQEMKKKYNDQTFFRVDSVRQAAVHWKNYAQKRMKLKKILAGSKV